MGDGLFEQMKQYHYILEHETKTSLWLFFRICIYRIGTALIIMACIRLTDNYYIFYPVIFFMGISFGYTLSLLILVYGFGGLICMAAYLFPQYLIYIPLFVGVLDQVSIQMDKAFPGEFRREFLILLILCAGCFLESFINPVVLKLVLNNI